MSRDNELLTAPGQLIDLDQAQHFVVSSRVVEDNSSKVAKNSRIAWPQTQEFSESLDGQMIRLTEKLEVSSVT